ncbi:MAG: DUF87 domain-containing protein [Notoacmeibacter sp.]|nr:DUF87 domain-containing protein [Notoacmeibacter sp.]MCC0032102.1 DUF87 domain-containing protein [Brucellaceae bacterium]
MQSSQSGAHEQLESAGKADPAGEPAFQRNRTEGYVVDCDGERAVIAAEAGIHAAGSDDYWAVGQMISVRVGSNRLVGLIYKVDVPDHTWQIEDNNVVHIYIELVGQVSTGDNGKANFSTGITSYPHMGAVAHRIRSGDLKAIYESTSREAVSIGEVTQDRSIPALIDIDKLLARHFAVVGTTGVGKSTAVSLILRKVVEKRPDIRVIVLDPHNEFTTAFADKAITVDANQLDLPFWIFKLEELTEVIFRGRTPVANEVDALRDLIPLAKERYRRAETGQSASQLLKRDRDVTSLTADTPVPYRIVDLLQLIDDRAGQLDGKSDRPYLRALKNRIESLLGDPRFRFMFGAKTISDTLQPVISHVFRLPQRGKPICVFEMSNLPAEVVNSVVSVLCRMAFDLALSSDGAIQTLMVCEEAHRYIPSDPNAGFWPTRQAIARIAKEGRKYGVYLGVITQRPGELDQTILSQCNTIFAMRLGNDRDQEIIRKAITGAARSMTNFLSSVANRECIAFGEAFHAPMRMVFETIAAKDLPGAHIYEQQARMKTGTEAINLDQIIKRMRHLEKSTEDLFMDEEPDFDAEVDADLLARVTSAPPAAPSLADLATPAKQPERPAAPPVWTPAAAVAAITPQGQSDGDAPVSYREPPAPGTGPQFWYADGTPANGTPADAAPRQQPAAEPSRNVPPSPPRAAQPAARMEPRAADPAPRPAGASDLIRSFRVSRP